MNKNWSKETDDFLSFYVKLQKSSNHKCYRFNLLAEQCGSVVENSHTKFLMTLLQYKNQYGYVFLDSFIALADFDIKTGKDEIHFDTEYFGRDDEDSAGRIDGLVYQKGRFAIIIENKINHADNQPEQIKRYIETIKNDQLVSNEKIYVVFLTRDGLESPDPISKECLKEYGICVPEEKCEGSDAYVLSGPRYFACSYAEKILYWLKENIQPSVAQKEVVLNAGLIQYIDYLEVMLGIKDDGLKKECREWFDNNIPIKGDETTQNTTLYDFYMWLCKEYPKKNNPDGDVEGVNMLKNIINDKNDELMGTLLSVTKDFFTSGQEPLMQKYHLNHHFTYYYITFCNQAWLKGIQFGWYPLGMKKLRDAEDLTFYVKIQSKELNPDSVLGKKLSELGYNYHKESKSYRVNIRVSQFVGKRTFFALDDNEKTSFLTEVYQEYALPLLPLIDNEYMQKQITNIIL